MILEKIDNFLSQTSEAKDMIATHKEMVGKMDWWHSMSGKPGDRFDKMRKEIEGMEKQMTGETHERARFNKLSAMKKQNVKLSKEAEREYKELKKKYGSMSEAEVKAAGEKLTFMDDRGSIDSINIPSGRSVILAKDESGRPKNTVMIQYGASGDINTEDNKGNKREFQNIQGLVKYLNKNGLVYFEGFSRI